MNRLDDIKKRLSRVMRSPYEVYANEGAEVMSDWVRTFQHLAPSDIQYLLNRLETVEMKLEKEDV